VGLRDRAVAAGTTIPLLPGIMPVTSYRRLMRIIELSGQRVPVDLAEQLHAVEGDPVAGREIGMTHAIEMCRQLLDAGAPGLHFYTFNRSKATLEVLSALGLARVPALST
jgi:methylenetetrahydrofolate reductase (NADPH)